MTPIQALLPADDPVFLAHCKKAGLDPHCLVTDRIRLKVILARFLSKTSLTRGQLWDLNLESYVYPLPKWEPGEREKHGV